MFEFGEFCRGWEQMSCCFEDSNFNKIKFLFYFIEILLPDCMEFPVGKKTIASSSF
jgi:hypothetical protein